MRSRGEGNAVILLALAVLAFAGLGVSGPTDTEVKAGYAFVMVLQGGGVLAVLRGHWRLALICVGVGLVLSPIMFLGQINCCLD